MLIELLGILKDSLAVSVIAMAAADCDMFGSCQMHQWIPLVFTSHHIDMCA